MKAYACQFYIYHACLPVFHIMSIGAWYHHIALFTIIVQQWQRNEQHCLMYTCCSFYFCMWSLIPLYCFSIFMNLRLAGLVSVSLLSLSLCIRYQLDALACSASSCSSCLHVSFGHFLCRTCWASQIPSDIGRKTERGTQHVSTANVTVSHKR